MPTELDFLEAARLIRKAEHLLQMAMFAIGPENREMLDEDARHAYDGFNALRKMLATYPPDFYALGGAEFFKSQYVDGAAWEESGKIRILAECRDLRSEHMPPLLAFEAEVIGSSVVEAELVSFTDQRTGERIEPTGMDAVTVEHTWTKCLSGLGLGTMTEDSQEVLTT